MTTENLRAIRAIHARIKPAAVPGKGWEEAYRQDVGALLAELDDLAALRIEREAHAAALQAARDAGYEARGQLAGLRIEHEAHAALLSITMRDCDEARAERDRLREVLACERGERAPAY